MIKVFLDNGVVKDIARVDPFTIFSKSYADQFIDAPDEVNINWSFDGVTWIPPIIRPSDLREQAKAARAKAVENIKVTTTAGHTFDGDETSQTRMARAVLVLPAGATVPWVLADNSVIQATSAELSEALALAGAAQAALWLVE